MCVVSNIGDYGYQTIPERYPWVWPYVAPNTPTPWYPPGETSPSPEKTIGWPGWNQPSQEQFDALKKEVEALKKLLGAGKEYDEATGQADCENADKIRFIKDVAKFVGVDLEDVLDSEEE